MDAALIYRAHSRWLIWVAFGCAVAIHLAAIAIAGNKARPVTPGLGTEISGVIGIDNGEQPPPEAEDVSPPDQVQPATDEDAFPEENSMRPPIHPRKKTPVTPLVRSIGTGTGRAMSSGSVKALTLYAPRPAYPYEARRAGITGSGVAQLTVNTEAGNVIDARMAQSTGSMILDHATVEALRNWRFKSGAASSIQVPVTYTLTGVSY